MFNILKLFTISIHVTLDVICVLLSSCERLFVLLTRHSLAVTPPRQEDFKRQVSCRNVLLSYVFGPKGSGKSCFINRLIRKGEIEISPETDRHICINKIR